MEWRVRTESRLANRFEVSGRKEEEEALTLPPPGQETLRGGEGEVIKIHCKLLFRGGRFFLPLQTLARFRAELQSRERPVSKQGRVFQTSTPKFLDQRGTAHAHRPKSDRKARQHHHPRYISVEVGALYTLRVEWAMYISRIQ